MFRGLKFPFSLFFCTVLFSVLLTSCSKDDNKPTNQSEIQLGKEPIDVTFAKTLAQALEIKEVRSFLRENTLYDRFGEPVISYATIMNKPIIEPEGATLRSGGSTFADILADVAGFSAEDADFFTTTIIEEMPLMGIYVISGDEEYDPLEWDINNDVPKVMPNPFDGEDYQKAYDSELNEYMLDEDYIDIQGNSLLLVYEETEIVLIDPEELRLINDILIEDEISARGSCETPNGLEIICDDFLTSIDEFTNSPPDFVDFDDYNYWIVNLQALWDSYKDLCCSEESDEGGSSSSPCFDSGNNFDRDSRDFEDELTGINVTRAERKKFCSYRLTCRYRVIMSTLIKSSSTDQWTKIEDSQYRNWNRSKHYNSNQNFILDGSVNNSESIRWRHWRPCQWSDIRVVSIIGINRRWFASSSAIKIGVSTDLGNGVETEIEFTIKKSDKNFGHHNLLYEDDASGPNNLGIWYNNGSFNIKVRERFED